jgi:DNA-directed RNA polymerase specialized sigma24 family protein
VDAVAANSVQPDNCLPGGLGVKDSEIWLSCKDDLARYAAVLIGPNEAEDVVSTVVVRVLRRRPLSDLDEARAYLFRAVLNECRNRLSRRRRTWFPADPAVPPPDEPHPEILDAVFRLPVRQRAATYLTYWADLPVAETARLMGVGDGTVKRYLFLARRTLKGVLDEYSRR